MKVDQWRRIPRATREDTAELKKFEAENPRLWEVAIRGVYPFFGATLRSWPEAGWGTVS